MKKYQVGGKVTASTLLNGKKISDLTEDDVRALAAKQKWSEQDTKRAIKGFRNFDKSAELEFDENGKTFNTVQGGRYAGPSSKSTGNKKGFQVGDLVGMGKNVNYFAGLIGSTMNAYKEGLKKTETKKADDGFNEKDELADAAYGERERATRAKQISQDTLPEDPRIPKTPVKPTPAENVFVYDDAPPVERYQPATTKKQAGKSAQANTESQSIFRTPEEMGQYLSNLAGRFNRGFVNLPATFANMPADIINLFGGNIPEEQKLGYGWQTNVTGELAKLPNSPLKVDSTINDIPSQIMEALPILMTGRTPAGQVFKSAPVTVKAADLVGKGAAKVERATKATAEVIPNTAKALTKMATRRGWVPSVANLIKFPELSKLSKIRSAAKSQTVDWTTGISPERVEAIKKMMYEMDMGFRSGGKLPKAQDGLKLPKYPWMTDPEIKLEPASATVALGNRLAQTPDTAREVEGGDEPPPKESVFKKFMKGDGLETAVSIGFPLLASQLLKGGYGGAGRPVEKVELAVMPEQDLPGRPKPMSLTTSDRWKGVDASVGRADQVNRDNANTVAENAWRMQNAMQKLATRQQGFNTINQGRMFNAQNVNQRAGQDQYIALQRDMFNKQILNSILEGTYGNVLKGIREPRVNRAAEQSENDRTIIKYGDENSQAYKEALKRMGYSISKREGKSKAS
jgi:hypothetical protein